MDTWGYYNRTDKGADGEDTESEILAQADPINKARAERKGFKFLRYATPPGVTPALVPCNVGVSAGEQIFGFLPEEREDLDASEIVKQAAEVALRKMTGTWTEAEAQAEEVAHAEGRYMPEETEFAIVQGNPLAGYEALSADGAGTAAVMPPATTSTGAGTTGTGTEAPAPPPAP